MVSELSNVPKQPERSGRQGQVDFVEKFSGRIKSKADKDASEHIIWGGGHNKALRRWWDFLSDGLPHERNKVRKGGKLYVAKREGKIPIRNKQWKNSKQG